MFNSTKPTHRQKRLLSDGF